jgi:hypothetical protein
LLQDHSGEQRVTNIELLFDLVNVFAVTHMSHHLLALWPGPGDLLFHHTDPTDPGHILYVAIYLADGKMIQAPETGENVEVVPADTRSEFARGDPGGPGAGRPGGRKYLTNMDWLLCPIDVFRSFLGIDLGRRGILLKCPTGLLSRQNTEIPA